MSVLSAVTDEGVSLSSIVAYVANMPRDVAYKVATEAFLRHIGFQKIHIPAGVVGADTVDLIERVSPSIFQISLSEPLQYILGPATGVQFSTRSWARVMGALGCTLTHRQIWLMAQMETNSGAINSSDFVAIFEDDIGPAGFSASEIRHIIEKALSSNRVQEHCDILYLYAIRPQYNDTTEKLCTIEIPGKSHSVHVVQIKTAYGTQGVIIRRGLLHKLCEFSDPDHVLRPSDCTLRRVSALTLKTCGLIDDEAHFVNLFAHLRGNTGTKRSRLLD